MRLALLLLLPLLAVRSVLGSQVLENPAVDEPVLEKTSEQGPVRVRIALAPAEPVIGDTLRLDLEVTAEPSVEVLMPEFGEALERYRILDFAPGEEIDDEGRTVLRQRYSLQPPLSGRHTIPPILVEFVDRRPGQKPAPEDEDAYEIFTERLDFEVQSVAPAEAGNTLREPRGDLAPLAPPPPPRWPWFLGGVVLLLLLSPVAWKTAAAWRRRARRRSAYELAVQRLERLLAGPRPSGEELDRFFVELSGIVRRYLEDRFELRAPELTTEEFLELVSDSPDLDAEQQRALRTFLNTADLVKFAHYVPADETVEEAVRTARQFLEDTRENAPLLDVEEESGDERREKTTGVTGV